METLVKYICAVLLLIGTSAHAWATDVVYNAVHNKPSNTKDVCGDGTWMASAGMHTANTDGVYWSVSTSTTPVKITDITNTEYTSRNVTRIVVTGKRNRDETFTIDATVGGNAFGSQYQGTGKSSGNDSYSATFSYPSGASGNIVLTLRTQGGGSIWVETITVTYSGAELHYGPNGATVTTIGVGEDFPSVDDLPGWEFQGLWATSADQDCEPDYPSGSTPSVGTAATSGVYYALYQGNAFGCNDGDYSCKPTPTYVLSLTNPSSGSGVNWVVADVGCGPVGTTITLTYTINVGGTSYQGADIVRDDNSAAVSFVHDAEEQTITFDLPAADVTATVNFECPDLTSKTVTINDIVPYYDAGAWKANVTWNAVDGATEYGIQVNDITGSSTFLPATYQAGTSYLLSGLTEGHTYRAIVQANNPCTSGNHTESATKNFTPDCPALEGTLVIALDEVTATGASISWSGATTASVPTGSSPSNAILYDVKISKSDGPDGGVLNVTDVDYAYWTNSTPLVTGATYNVQVTAKNVCGETMVAVQSFKCKAYTNYQFTCADLSLTDEDGTHAPIWITSTAGKMVRSQKALHIEGTGLKPNGAFTFTIGGVAANNCASGDVFAIRQADGSAVAADASGNIDMDVYVFYQPNVATDGLDLNAVGTAIVATSAEGTVPPAVREYKAMSATLANVAINGRHLPTTGYVIAGKKNNKWYALPSNMASTTNPKPSEIAVDDINNPSIAYTATSNIYSMEGPTAANISGGNGQYIRLTMSIDDGTLDPHAAPLFGSATGTRTIGKSGNSQASSDLSAGWWWSLTQTNTSITNPQDAKYTIKCANNTSTLSLRDNAGNPDWGLFASGVEELRLIPASDIIFAEADVVEWGQHAAIIEVDATAATGIDATSVIAHLGAASSSAIELVQTRASDAKNATSKYNYTVNFGDGIDFADAASNGAMLTLEWKNGATTKAVSNIVVPKIIATSATMSSLMSGDAAWGTADVHVLPGVTLTANAGDFPGKDVVVNSMEIYPGATVKVTKGAQDVGTLKVRTLVLRNGWTRVGTKNYDVARLYVSTDANLAKSAVDNVWYTDWYIDYDQYYPIAVPFPVATSGISYKNSNSSASAGVIIRYYDGARRAEHEQQDQADNWVAYTWGVGGTIPENLAPSTGYAMTAKRPSGKAFSIVRMPMTFTNPWTALGEHGYIGETHKDQVTVTGYGKDTAPWYAMGWNFVANPYMCTFNGDDDGISGKISKQGGGTIKYATIPDVDFKNYSQVPIAEANLKPASAFFIQADDADPQTITFSDGKIVPPSAPERYMTTDVTIPEQEAYIRLSNGAEKDLMGLIIGEDYTEAYEANADLAKILGAGNSVKTYMRYGEMDMAYVAINKVLARQWIPVTVNLPADGEYTFSLTNSSTVDALEGVYLIDYTTNEITNLIENDYTFVAEAGTSTDRFAINAIVGQRETPTAIDVVGVDKNGDEPIKFLYHDKVFIWHRGVIYDATGKKVR